MSDLFIMGNGFDRAHGMETSYYDFHQFIKDNCKNMPYIGVVELVSQDSENKIDGMIVYEPVEYLEFFQIIKDRIQEMLNLGYFDLYSKGGKLRRLYIPKKLREETQKWLSEEQRTSGYLFLNRFTGTNVVKIASIVYAQSVKLSLCISIPT